MSDMPLDSKPETAQIAPDKPLPVENRPAKINGMSQADLIARRNALVKELFRTGAQIHPPRPSAPQTPNIPKTPATAIPAREIENWEGKQPTAKQPKTVSKEKASAATKNEQLDLEQAKLDEIEKNRKMQSINGVHMDLYGYFSIDVNVSNLEILRRLQFVNSWVATEGKTFYDGMRKLHRIDRQLGSADTGDTKLIKIYNWLRFSGRK